MKNPQETFPEELDISHLFSGLTFWKKKNTKPTPGFHENIFLRTDDIARYFSFQHEHMLKTHVFPVISYECQNHLHTFEHFPPISNDSSTPLYIDLFQARKIITQMDIPRLQDKKMLLLQNILQTEKSIRQNLISSTKQSNLISETLEIYFETDAGLSFWKTKGLEITWENFHENVFLLSANLADYFGIRHHHFIDRNLSRLRKKGYLPKIMHSAVQMVEIGSSAQKPRDVYFLNSPQVQYILADLKGKSVQSKKIEVLHWFFKLETEIEENQQEQELETREIIQDSLELYCTTPDGLRLYKSKGIDLSFENFLDNFFILSSDLAAHFGIRHDNLVAQNIRKLQIRNHLPEHLLKIKEMFRMGNHAWNERLVYILTRPQAEHLIVDFSGLRAADKKHELLARLHAIEAQVFRGSLSEARSRGASWDGVKLLDEFGFTPSLPGQRATKKDILDFLHIPPATLDSFLRRHREQIQPVQLSIDDIRAAGLKSNRLNSYNPEDVLKMTLWIESSVGMKFKQRLLGEMGTGFRPGPTHETQWADLFQHIFQGLGFSTQFPIATYRVDFYVQKLALILECDGESHYSYDPVQEKIRERILTKTNGLIRFSPHADWRKLFNAILQITPGKIIRLPSALHFPSFDSDDTPHPYH